MCVALRRWMQLARHLCTVGHTAGAWRSGSRYASHLLLPAPARGLMNVPPYPPAGGTPAVDRKSTNIFLVFYLPSSRHSPCFHFSLPSPKATPRWAAARPRCRCRCCSRRGWPARSARWPRTQCGWVPGSFLLESCSLAFPKARAC